MLSDPTPDGVSLGQPRVPLEEGALRVRSSTELDGLDDVQVIDFDELPAGGLVSTALFEDAVVLVGTVDPRATRYVDTPVGRMPEVLVHANALNTLLAGETITVASGGWSTVVTIAAAAAVVLAAGRRRWLAWLVAVAIAAGWLLIVRTRADGGELLPPLGVPVAALGAALLTEVIAQVSALSERRRLRSLFARYVPPTVAQQLVASGRGTAASEGERVAVTVLFCDLRGFTPMAGLLEPTKIRELLNRYYEAMSVVVFRHRGTVLQYTGDEVFAVFGAPVPMDRHADAALECAREMFQVLPALNADLAELRLPHLDFGIGLHSGDVVAAHVGSSIRMQYTVVGDTVNVANRHCSLAAAGQIVLSSVTTALLDDTPADAVRIDDAALKGVAGRHTAYRLDGQLPEDAGPPPSDPALHRA